jgi:hypothetical protein
MRLDFTLTLPGLFEIQNIENLSKQLDSEILAKVIFSFTPDIIMSPLALPRTLLNTWIDEILNQISNTVLRDLLLQLKSRPNFQEQWPNDYAQSMIKGKSRILQLEKIRNDKFTMRDILSSRKQVLEWWDDISH